MGVAGLWDILKPAARTRSLTEVAIKEGFEANPDGKRGFRLGIDASIWFFHAEYGREGENPVLRTLFFRCATLMHTTFLPLFVFDGPKRPDVKRGKKINRTSHKLIPGMKQIVEAFGFEWRMAPGEAEAELAYLNRIGVIDGVLSDDVDNFLFGATTVIRNSSSTLSGNRANPTLNSAGKDDKNHTRVFRLQDISSHPDVRLTRGGLILIGLMSGGDYQQGGLMRCGTTTSHALAKCGFGDSLYDAAVTLNREALADFIVSWRHDLCQELRTNSKGHIGRKQVALAKSITEEFPDIDILLSYVRPITSESMGRESNNTKLTWAKEPDLPSLAAVCEFYFEWGYKEAIVKRFRTVMWHSIVLRILRRAVLDQDAKRITAFEMPATPRKNKGTNSEACGTPSKMILKHFSSLALTSPKKVYISGSESEDDDEEDRLIIKVHSSRTHTSTDGLLEYRLEISPKQLVKLTESGIKGIRVPEGPDEWASENEDEDGAKKGKGQPIEPESHQRLWMPACMVKLVEPRLVQEFEDKEEEKRAKKAKKGTRPKAAADKEKNKDKPKEKTARKPKKAAAKPVDDDVFSSPVVAKPKIKKAVAASPRRAVSVPSTDDEYDLFEPDFPHPSKATNRKQPQSMLTPSPSKVQDPEDLYQASPISSRPGIEDLTKKSELTPSPSKMQAPGNLFPASPISTRTGIKDLTKKKPATSSGPGRLDLKSFYSVTKSSMTTTYNKDPFTSIGSSSQNSASIQSSISSSSQMKVGTSSEQTSNSFGLGKKGKASATSKASAAARFNKLYVTDDESLDESNPTLFNKIRPTSNPVPPSPSKRKNAQRKSASSDSEPSERLQKSPRKKVNHTSPQHTRRPTSPSPASPRPPVRRMGEVIEISDSDSDDLPPPTSLRSLPPLLAARARANASSNLNPISQSAAPIKQRRKVPPIMASEDIIDLT